ncbi:electron transport complex subunit RsxB [Methylovorus mays]|uniref:electron transport complex subunit RsxB n=1 Tax=Methylovorus mays TaxID=184077 RepID=UPI001E534B9C|nr:electron transport complex subunit RsxB [Methylovorus mays]MCB5205671.1 electron transport complex subunit RsxB [Methylovorus mays]
MSVSKPISPPVLQRLRRLVVGKPIPSSLSALQAQDETSPLVASIDAILPQTQCTQCGYQGCKPYAEAIARGEANINQCPPGGDAGIRALASLLQRPYIPLNPQHGIQKPKQVAVIDEQTCIGCTLCIQACPVDAILGASKQMHTVIADECTGCELCIAPCPVDCISMQPPPVTTRPRWRYPQFAMHAPAGPLDVQEANIARERHAFRVQRQAREQEERARKLAQRRAASAANSTTQDPAAEQAALAKKAAIAAAMARVQAQKAASAPRNTEVLSPTVAAEIAAIEARRAQMKKTDDSAD